DRGVFTTRQTRFLPRAAFFRGAAPPPRRRDGRRDTRTLGTRWDPREAEGCLMVCVEPDSRSGDVQSCEDECLSITGGICGGSGAVVGEGGGLGWSMSVG
ncbi:unnamed protein product, partial [Staurois parvus]